MFGQEPQPPPEKWSRMEVAAAPRTASAVKPRYRSKTRLTIKVFFHKTSSFYIVYIAVLELNWFGSPLVIIENKFPKFLCFGLFISFFGLIFIKSLKAHYFYELLHFQLFFFQNNNDLHFFRSVWSWAISSLRSQSGADLPSRIAPPLQSLLCSVSGLQDRPDALASSDLSGGHSSLEEEVSGRQDRGREHRAGSRDQVQEVLLPSHDSAKQSKCSLAFLST